MTKERQSHTEANDRYDPDRQIAAPTGSQLSCKSWLIEAPHADADEQPAS